MGGRNSNMDVGFGDLSCSGSYLKTSEADANSIAHSEGFHGQKVLGLI